MIIIPITIIIITYLLIFLHELCHGLFFFWQGIQIRIFYLFPFELTFTEEHVVWKLKTTKKYYGIVIPGFTMINRENIDLLRKKCIVAIISSSCMHVFLSFIGGIMYLCLRSDFWLVFIFINLFMLLQGFYETKWAYGDIIAFEKIKNSYIEYILYIAFAILNDEEVLIENLEFVKGELEKIISKEKNTTQDARIKNCIEQINNRM